MNDIFHYIILKYAVKSAFDNFDCLERGRLRRISKRTKKLVDEYNFKCQIPDNRKDVVMWLYLEMELVRQPIFLIVMLDNREWTYTHADLIYYFRELETAVIGDYLKPLNVIKKNYWTIKKEQCPAKIHKSKDFLAVATKCLILNGPARDLSDNQIKCVLKNGGIVINLCHGRHDVNKFCLNNSAALIDS